MFQIGDSLKEARARRGLSPADVHKAIRIRERYLTALEEERWDMLPGEAYTKGFLRGYAEFLGLNGQLYIDEYNARIAPRGEDEPPLVPEALAPKRTRNIVLRTLVGIIVVGAGVAALAAWRLGGASTPPARLAAQNPVTPVAATHRAAKQTPKPVVTAPSFATVTADGRSWVQVRAHGPNGAVLFQGFLDIGTTKRFDVTTNVWVRMGRPDQLTIKVAGHLLKPQSADPANLLLTQTGAQPA